MFKMLGAGNEDANVSCVSLSSGARSRPNPPTFKIENEKGETISEGAFHYG